jgi:thiol-disulfide isomerase/thioredoxin
MKKTVVSLFVIFIMTAGVYGQRIDRQVPNAIVRAFKDAGIPVMAQGIDPVDFTLPLLDGTTVTLSQFKGKVVFLNFWATWCGPCRSEMPSMEAVYQRLKNQGIEILAVNLGDSKNTV